MDKKFTKLGKVAMTTDGQWDSHRPYDELCLVHDGCYGSYVSRCKVPPCIPLADERYWQPVGKLNIHYPLQFRITRDGQLQYKAFHPVWMTVPGFRGSIFTCVAQLFEEAGVITRDELHEIIQSIESQIAELETKVDELDPNSSNEKYDEIESQIKELTENNEKLTEDVSNLSEQVTSLTEQNSSLNDQLTSLQGIIASLQSTVASLQETVEELKNNSGTGTTEDNDTKVTNVILGNTPDTSSLTLYTVIQNSDSSNIPGSTIIAAANAEVAGLMSAEDKAHFDQMYQDYVDGGFCHCGDGTITYDDPEITSFSYPNMPAEGGTIYPTYTYKQTYTKSDGTTGEITGGGELKFEEA